ncbi:MAG TPA: 3-oxoadipate enol-lactonase [Nocardioidaceae bacterium]|nr:3-oxoadipate enol-lactonase [Nocardioidaceae bacterium]
MSVALHHVVTGIEDAPVVVLGSSLGTDLHMWDPQTRALSRRWRVVAFDARGHGGSPCSDGPTTLDALAEDVLALLDHLGVGSFAYCGLSLGGAIGQVLAARVPDRVRALVLCCTSARFCEGAEAWRERAARVRSEGMDWLVAPSRERWFAPGFSERQPAEADRLLSMLPATSPQGYAACCDALAAFDGRPLLPQITAPTLVVAGVDDPATPVEMAEELASGIKDAELLVVPGASHLASAERPDEVTEAIAAHLDRNLG